MNRRDMRAVRVDDKMGVLIKKIGVIGSGQMGNGIAHVAALAGLDVVLNDISADRLKSAMATINGNLSRQVVKKLCTRLGKQIALSEDFPAFIVNRILQPMINEAIYTLYEGVANVEAIDAAMKLGAHHRMGPLELADFIGLDTCLSIMQMLHEGLADSKYRPCPLLVKYVEAGWLGRKTQRGFYDYRGDKPVPTR